MTHSCINVSKAYPKITDIVPQKGQNDSKIVIFVLAIVYDVISYSVWSVILIVISFMSMTVISAY